MKQEAMPGRRPIRYPFARALLLAGVVACSGAGYAQETSPSDRYPDAAPLQQDEAIPLYLLVIVNGMDTEKVAPFQLLGDTRIAASAAGLRDIGINVPENGDTAPLLLDDIDGLRYQYDASRQAIELFVSDALLEQTLISGRQASDYRAPDRSAGAYVNYSAFVAGGYYSERRRGSFDLASLSLDAHTFNRFGIFSQSGIVGTSSVNAERFVRLDSVWSYSDPLSLTTYRAGDLISGGLSWSRPIRLGGFQIQRNFSLRPDLITVPLPSISGSAAVPSTLDVYIGNLKTYSTELPSGPYRINDLPIVSGAGTARIVVTDIVGRQVETEASFFSDTRILREGLLDYSIEGGFPRTQFGTGFGTYDPSPILSAGARYGVTNEITIEAHTEMARDGVLFGGGGNFNLNGMGLLSTAGAHSTHAHGSGTLVYVSWFLPAGDFNLQAASSRTFGDYRDVASLIAPDPVDPAASRPARATEQLSASYRFDAARSSVSITAIHSEQFDAERTFLLTASFNRAFENGISLFANAVYDAHEGRASAAFLGLTIPLGDRDHGFAGITSDDRGLSFAAQLQRNIGTEPGSYGGRLAVSQGEETLATAYGAVSLRSGLFESTAAYDEHAMHLNAAFSGSLVLSHANLYAARQITDAFAVVDANAPNVDVYLENRPMGRTRGDGTMLLTGLNSYQENLISIGVENLPVDTAIPVTTMRVVPAERSGVDAAFPLAMSIPSAIVTFERPDGGFVDVGAAGTLEGNGEDFFVGYDGRAFISQLSEHNSVVIVTPSGECRAEFDYSQREGSQVVIGPVICN